ncbi:hypothetical protein [Tolypothrix sp. PCC 7910]|nr:hypothetical protein [Tolypothrix sp. PCC 7910]
MGKIAIATLATENGSRFTSDCAKPLAMRQGDRSSTTPELLL